MRIADTGVVTVWRLDEGTMSETTHAAKVSGVPRAYGSTRPSAPDTAPPTSSLAEQAVLVGLIASSVALAAFLVADITQYAM
jgi:hypothetical protein